MMCKFSHNKDYAYTVWIDLHEIGEDVKNGHGRTGEERSTVLARYSHWLAGHLHQYIVTAILFLYFRYADKDCQ